MGIVRAKHNSVPMQFSNFVRNTCSLARARHQVAAATKMFAVPEEYLLPKHV